MPVRISSAIAVEKLTTTCAYVIFGFMVIGSELPDEEPEKEEESSTLQSEELSLPASNRVTLICLCVLVY